MSDRNRATDERPPFILIDQSIVDDFQLHPLAGWLYVVIVRHVNHKMNDAFPSIPRLAKLASMSRASVLRYTKVLEDAGLIKVTRDKDDDGENHVNHYHLLEVKRGISQQRVVSHRHHPSVTQTPPVVSESNPNQIQLNQIHEPEKEVPLVDEYTSEQLKSISEPIEQKRVGAEVFASVISKANGNGSRPYTDAELQAQTAAVIAKYGGKST